MRAIMMNPGPAGASLELTEVPTPVAGPGQVLVAVRATALNRGEIGQRRSARSGEPKPSGIEFAGEVVALGDGTRGLAVGQRVMGMAAGSHAEYVAVEADLVMPVPQWMSWHEAAAFPNVYTTAHDALVTNGAMRPTDAVLINAASSGIGLAAAQIARALGAGCIIGTTRSAEKIARMRECGFTALVDASSEDVPAAVARLTSDAGVDIVVDSVGAAALASNMACLALDGRLIQVGRLGGKTAEIDLDFLALKRLRLIGVTFRTRTAAQRVACFQACVRDLAEHVERGAIRPLVDRAFPLEQISQAQDYMETDSHVGKIVLEV